MCKFGLRVFVCAGVFNFSKNHKNHVNYNISCNAMNNYKTVRSEASR